MHEVIPRQLWIGNASDARDLRKLNELAVSAVVDLAAEERPLQLARDMAYFRISLVDGGANSSDWLAVAIGTVVSLIRERIPAAVTCGSGMSRSPAIVAAALARVRGNSPDDCLQQLIVGRPHDVSPPLWRDVKTVESQHPDYAS